MKQMFKFFIAFASIALIGLQACSLEETAICPEDPGTGGEPTPIKFTTKAPVATRTSADGNSWSAGDSVGIYMLDDPNPATPQLIATSLNSNREYFVQGNGALEDLKPFGTQALYYKDPAPLRFISYYPYLPNITGYTIPIDVRKQDRPQDIDVLYSNNTRQIVSPASGGTSPVRLTYQHILSKLIIDVRKGTNTDVNIHGMTGEIEDQPLTGNFHLDNVWTSIGTPKGVVGLFGIGKQDANYDTTYQAILIPHDPIGNAKELIQFRTQRRLYSWKLPVEMDKFEAGMVYHFQLTLLGETDIEFKGEIKPWDEATLTGPGDDIGWQDESGAPYTKILYGGLDTLAVRYMKGGGEPFQMGTLRPLTAYNMPTTPLHNVELTTSFHITEAEITTAQYCTFLNDPDNRIVGTLDAAGSPVDVSYWIPGATAVALFSLPSTNNNTIKLNNGKWEPATNGQFPMAAVSWFGAQAYARWAGGNLPTEAQWEFVARDKVDVAKDFIDPPDFNGGGMNNNYAHLNSSVPLPVKSMQPSPNYKMYDMFGNVAEWCYDRFATDRPPYPGGTVTDPNDPQGAAPTGDNGVARGGSIDNTTAGIYIGIRIPTQVSGMSPHIGFRVVFAFN
ncbi:hypothetical protein FACS1894181_16370 [Bacteroidia bacterium]|nr:hypothetical protein FACS1894181_16370 [Bacteroidia bacterium]